MKMELKLIFLKRSIRNVTIFVFSLCLFCFGCYYSLRNAAINSFKFASERKMYSNWSKFNWTFIFIYFPIWWQKKRSVDVAVWNGMNSALCLLNEMCFICVCVCVFIVCIVVFFLTIDSIQQIQKVKVQHQTKLMSLRISACLRIEWKKNAI